MGYSHRMIQDMTDSRTVSDSDLIRAGAWFQFMENSDLSISSLLLVVPKKVQERIAHMGDMVYGKLNSDEIQKTSEDFRTWYKKQFGTRELSALNTHEIEGILREMSRIHVADIRRLERRFPQLRDKKWGFLREWMDINTLDELVNIVRTWLQSGHAIQAKDAEEKLRIGKYIFDKTLDQ